VNGRPDARHRARNVGGRRCGTFRKLCSVSLLSSRRFSHNLAQPQTALPKPRVAQIVGGRAQLGEPHAGRPATPTIIEATGCLTWGPPHRAQPIQAGLQAEGELADAPSAISKVQLSESLAENVTIELAAIVAVDSNGWACAEKVVFLGSMDWLAHVCELCEYDGLHGCSATVALSLATSRSHFVQDAGRRPLNRIWSGAAPRESITKASGNKARASRI
jgi:hypothetical protein